MRAAIMIAALLAALGLSGCKDNYRITHVNQYPGWSRSHITAAGSVPTELHGLPLAGMSAQETLARLKAPHNLPAGLRFVAATPESGARLILIFNGGAPDAFRMCAETRQATTAPPAQTGFSVAAAYCAGGRALASGYMVAPEATTEDPRQFTRLMRNLFGSLFAEPDND